MIGFTYETNFSLSDESVFINWITKGVEVYGKRVGEIHYYFYNDAQLLKINQQHLQHETYTDIISFDYSVGDVISGDICISIDRVRENADTYSVTFEEELARVMSHGVLHFLGYKDKLEQEKKEMRKNERIFINLLINK